MGFGSGIYLVILAFLASIHWWFSHVSKYLAGNPDSLAPEMGVVVFGLWIGAIFLGRQKG